LQRPRLIALIAVCCLAGSVHAQDAHDALPAPPVAALAIADPEDLPTIVAAAEPSPAVAPVTASGTLADNPRDAEPSVGAAESAAPVAEPAAPVASASPPDANLWERIRAGFRLPEISDSLVRKWENYYAARPEYWLRIAERGKRYLYFITAELERRRMPLEIALLPIIESAYNPEALSRARASGIWQFVPDTGKTYGLKQNWWLDDRRDVTVATGSALDYLERLHAMFGDWQLALASYNWGEGAVQRAINRNRGSKKATDYASLRVPNETRNYLPKLQAVKNLVMTPEKFGLDLPAVPDHPYFTVVTTERQIDVALAARLAEMPIEEFKSLNPAHNRPVIAGGDAQRIMLPYLKAEAFVLNLDAYELPLVSWRPYQLKSGERLEQVAPKFGIDIDELKRVNGLVGRKKIVPGHALLVPAAEGEAPAERIPTTIFKDAPNDGPLWHRVRRGETLDAIARHHSLTAADLRRLNGLPDNYVVAGLRLRLHDGAGAGAGTPKSRSKSVKRSVKKPPVKPTRKR
jgi:membrane-bound lytic murein transglycosylase D